jgi:P22 coat protein - gene protein 5
MANALLTPSIIAKEALMQLENNCVMANCVYRDYSEEFVKVGNTISVRRPVQFTVTDGATLDKQDVVEGKFSVAMDLQKHVGWGFNSADLTLTIDEYSERYIKPAAIQLANKIDASLTGLYKDVWNWVGTLGSDNTIDSFADFSKGPERLDNGAVPTDNRHAVLSPTDQWALLGSQTALFFNSVGEPAYRRGSLGMIGGVKTYMDQNVAVHTTGTRTNSTPLADAAAGNGVLSTTYALSKNSGEMVLSSDGWASSTLTQGDVFTINTVFAVNPVSKATQAYLQQFVVKAAASVSSSDSECTISPPIITSGAYQTVNEAAADGDTIVNMGTSATNYIQNLCFHRNAFALVMRPLAMPDGVAFKSRQSKNGFSIRVVKDYDITNDEDVIRLDVLYGVTTIDARLATRMSGDGT